MPGGRHRTALRLTVVLGFAVPQFGESAHDELARFASTAEQLGADSLWVGDRLLAPVNPTVGYAGKDTIPSSSAPAWIRSSRSPSPRR